MSGRIITFYSYKGGVGRTFLMANIAALFAMWGRKVLAIDFDLEAPGLDRYFGVDLTAEPFRGGMLDVIERLDSNVPTNWEGSLRRVELPSASGRLDLLPAGDGEDYGERLGKIHWPELYDRGIGRKLEGLREEWADAYDFILIDSRTGLTDAGGVCTVQLPDIVVFLVTATLSSLEGAVEAMKRADKSRQRLPIDRAGIGFLPIPSRFHAWDDRQISGPWRDRYATEFVSFYHRWIDTGVDAADLLDLLKVPYSETWSYGERLAVVAERLSDNTKISYHMSTIAALLARDLADTDELVRSRDEYVRAVAQPKEDSSFEFDIFLAYSRDGLAIAKGVRTELSRRGMSVWFDEDQKGVGTSYFAALDHGLNSSRALVWLIGRISKWSAREAEAFASIRADDKQGRPIIPLRIEGDPSESLPLDVATIDCTAMTPAEMATVVESALAGDLLASRADESRPDEPLDVDPISAWRRHQRALHKNLIPYFQGAGDRLLEQVFVDLDVDRDMRHAMEGNHGPERAERRDLSRGGSLETILEEPADGDVARRLVVLGEPGAGKTTLARNLCRSLAERDDAPVPVYVSLSRFADQSRDPFDFSEGELRASSPAAPNGLARDLREEATRGNLWLILDGLDEVASEQFSTVCKQIETLAAQFTKMPIVVLSRLVVFEDRTLGQEFDVARVRPLDDARQKTLLVKLLGADDGASVFADLRRQPRLIDVARNPLLLTLVAVVGSDALSAGRSLPTRRGRLYAAAIDLFLRRGYCPDPRGVKDRATARRVLRPLSLRLHQLGGEAWTFERLSEVLWEVRREGDEINFAIKETWETNDALLDDLATNSGVLGPHDGPREPWRYLHRSFREYLAAEALSTASDESLERIFAGVDEAVAKKNEEKKAGESADEDPLERYIARWGEVWALLATVVEKPEPILERLAAASGEIVRRVLPGVEGLDPTRGLKLLFESGDFGYEALGGLVRSWGVASHEASELLWRFVTKERSLTHLSYLRYALDEIGVPPDRERFFEQAGRPIDQAPKIDWVTIPSGTFTMGSEKRAERPAHVVTVGPFLLARAPVTVEQYSAFVRRDGEVESSTDKAEGKLPAVEMNWWEARLFSWWVGGRLPSEAEWEYACRAGTNTEYWSGDSEEDLAQVGWYDKNSRYELHPAGEKPASPWNLHDMHGNVGEWCEDAWHGNYEGAPADGTAWVDEAAERRVVRGGSSHNDARFARSAFRFRLGAALRWFGVGFRPASSVTPS